MELLWDPDKDLWLRQTRSIGFEDVRDAFEHNGILDDIPNPAHAHQRMLVLKINGYVCVAPYVKSQRGMFLKTVYRSRVHNALYGGENGKTEQEG